MPRARGNNSDRGNRFNTYVSGVTLQTNPSGATIVKSGVTATVVSATSINATKLTATSLTNATGDGYTLPYLTTGLLMKTGIMNGLTGSGSTKVDAAFFGLTGILFCIAAPAVTNQQCGGTTLLVRVTTANVSRPAAGVSRVYFRVCSALGTAQKKPVSVQYFAIGT